MEILLSIFLSITHVLAGHHYASSIIGGYFLSSLYACFCDFIEINACLFFLNFRYFSAYVQQLPRLLGKGRRNSTSLDTCGFALIS
jgi:hypothetical protein